MLHVLSHWFKYIRTLARHPLTAAAHLVAVAVVGAWLAVSLWGDVRLSLGLATVEGGLRPAVSGRTTVEFPPFGSLSAHTHRAPLALQARVDELHVKQLVTWAKDAPSRTEMTAQLRHAAQQVVVALLLRATVLALLGAIVLGVISGLRGRRLALCGLLGLAAVLVPVALAAGTFRAEAFADPTYHGELSRAPLLLQAAHQGWRRYDTLDASAPVIIDRVTRFYRQLDALGSLPATADTPSLRVLQISDLHNNPLGLRFAVDLAQEYAVDLVVVTGDLTDYGHALEAELLSGWERFHVPVVAISGNHDSRFIMSRLAKLPRVTVLSEGETVSRAGLTIMGFGDPAAERRMLGGVNATKDELRALRTAVRDRLAAGKPDLLLIHNNSVARDLLGQAPVILTGHSHVPLLLHRKEGVLINAGTTGAAGLRYFSAPKQPPYGAAVLHFAPGTHPELKLVDFIEMEEPAGNFAIRRQNLAAGPASAPIRAHALGLP